MKMKRLWKIGLTLIFILIIQLNVNFVNAENLSEQLKYEQTTYVELNNMSGKEPINITKTGIWSNILNQGSNFLSDGQTESTDELDSGKINETSSAIYNLLLGVAIVLTVIIGGILGIKFMIASAEDKAEIKKAMIPYILGCVVVFGAFTIWKIAVNVLQTIAVS